MEVLINPPGDVRVRVLEHQMEVLLERLTTLESEVDRLTQLEDDVIRLEDDLRSAAEDVATLKRGRLARIESSVTDLRQAIEPPIYAKGDRVIITNKIKRGKIPDNKWTAAWESVMRRATIMRIEPAKGTKPVKIHLRTDTNTVTWRYAHNLKRNTSKGCQTIFR
jgi:hypothetical protein